MASRFAINDILIPNFLLTKAFHAALAGDDSTIPTLAKMFMVTNSMMSIRMGVPYETGSNERPLQKEQDDVGA